jgi:hypothetical protein
MHRAAIAIVGITLLFPCLAGCADSIARDTTCTDAMVAQLVAANVAADLILDKINQCEPHFDMDPAHLIALKQAGVPDDLVRAMSARQMGRSYTAPAAIAGENDAGGAVPDEVGVYCIERGGQPYRIEGIAISNTRTGSTLASKLTLHIKRERVNAQLRGPQAQLRLRERQPQFYLYLPEGSSVTDYLLLRLEKREDVRQLEISETTFWKHQEGVDHFKEIDFSYKRLGKGLYILTPNIELASGEYGFYVAAGSEKGVGRVYDFGVD